MDVNAQVTEDISVFAGVGLLDSEIKENKNRPLSEGNTAPQSPDETFTLGINWDYSINQDLVLTTRLDWQYVGETYFHSLQGEQTPTIWDFFGTLGGGVPAGPHPVDFTNATRDAYDTLNLRISLDSENWTVALWSKNLTDETYLQEVIPTPEFGGSFLHPSALRSYGVDFSYRF